MGDLRREISPHFVCLRDTGSRDSVSHTEFTYGSLEGRCAGIRRMWTDDISNEEEVYLKSEIECTARRGKFPRFLLMGGGSWIWKSRVLPALFEIRKY